MRRVGWGAPLLLVGLGAPILGLAFWGWLVGLAAVRSQAIVVDHAASEGTANLPALLTADMVIVTNGRDPQTPDSQRCRALFEGRGSGSGAGHYNRAPVSPAHVDYLRELAWRADGAWDTAPSPWGYYPAQVYRIAIADVLSSEAFDEASRRRTNEPWPHTMRVWNMIHITLIKGVYHGDDIVFTTEGCRSWRVEPTD